MGISESDPRSRRRSEGREVRPEQQALSIAWLQSGVITHSQALEAGMTARQVRERVASGRWRRLSRGVYATDSAIWHQAAWAGLLMAGDGACLGGRAAAFLHGFDTQPGRIDVWVPPGSAVPRRGAGRADGAGPTHSAWRGSWRFRQGSRTAVGIPPRSCVEETVLDRCEEMLAGGFAQRSPMEQWNERMYPVHVRFAVRRVLTAALESGMTSVDRLLAALDRSANLEGRQLVVWELDEMTAGRRIRRDGASLYRRTAPGQGRVPTD